VNSGQCFEELYLYVYAVRCDLTRGHAGLHTATGISEEGQRYWIQWTEREPDIDRTVVNG
jgi:hypothetical protein